MASVVVRGKAVVEGIAGSFDAILYSLPQTGKITQNFDEEIIKDQHGYDLAWVFRNEHVTGDFGLKVIGDTHAHALIPATVVAAGAGTAGSAISSAGQPFITPGSQITFTGFDLSVFNGVFQVLSGGDIDIANTKVADLAVKVRKYADSGQQTLAATIPT